MKKYLYFIIILGFSTACKTTGKNENLHIEGDMKMTYEKQQS